jgi:hypothetical protein
MSTNTRIPNPALDSLYIAVGRALSAWSAVEEALCSIYVRSLMPDHKTEVGSAIASFWAVDAFSSKLNMADASIQFRFAREQQLLSAWKILKKRAGDKSRARNELAHGCVMTMSYRVQRKEPMVREMFFAPSMYKQLNLLATKIPDDWLSSGYDPRPEKRLTAAQIDHRTQAFQMFAKRLRRFDECMFRKIEGGSRRQQGEQSS